MAAVIEQPVDSAAAALLASARAGGLSLPEVMDRAGQLQQAARPELAVALYATWIAHTDSPMRHVACFNWGTMLGSLNRHDEAEAAYRQALALQPGFPPARLNLGHLLERRGENEAALAEWQQVQVGQIPRSEIVRHVIEYSMVAAHRHVFGVFFWYAVLSIIGLGPVGAVVYRLTEFVQRKWPMSANPNTVSSDVLCAVAARAWVAMDWLPSRMTALGFAIVGSFEEAMDGWRNHAQNFPEDNDGVILAATAGAINIRLGGASLQSSDDDSAVSSDSSSTPGRSPEIAHFAQVVGLVWRTVIMWLVLVALLTMANLVG